MPNRPNHYANLEKYHETTRKQNKRYYAKSQVPGRRRRAFSEKEDSLILLHEIEDSKLSKLIHRSVMSIQLRRSRLKKRMAEEE